MIGIDLSKHNGNIDFKKVKAAGVEFAILRAGYGKSITQKDPKFEQYYEQCKKNNINVGAYWYSYAKSVEEIKIEAKCFLEVIKGKKFEMPIYLDFEEESQFKLSKKTINEMISTFLNILEENGYFAGLYMSKSYLENYVNDYNRARYSIWLAHYTSKTTYKNKFDLWQWTNKGHISGINGDVDMDLCGRDFKNIMIKNKLNGY